METQFKAVYTRKGGKGKTFLSTHIAHYLALIGKKVLLIDIDPQGHSALALGMAKTQNLYLWLVENKPLDKVILDTGRDNLQIVSGNSTTELIDRHFLHLAEMHIESTGDKTPRTSLAIKLIQVRLSELIGDRFDHVVFDCPPRRTLLAEAILAMCDSVVIPTDFSSVGLDGMANALAECKKLSESSLLYIFPNDIDSIHNGDYDSFLELKQNYSGSREIVLNPAPHSKAAEKYMNSGKTLFEVGSRKRGTVLLVIELIKQLGDYLK